MEEIKKKVIISISEQIERQSSDAYFEGICYEVFGELNEENEIKLKKILEELVEENRITVNGDRIGIKKSDFLVLSMDENEVEKLNKVGLKCNSKECDIGHGYNIPGLGIDLDIGTIVDIVVGVGLYLNDIKGAVEGYRYVKNKIKEAFSNNEEVYYGEDMLKLRVLEKILYEFQGKEISQINLISKSKVKIGATGMYSVQNYGFSEESIEGTPEFIGYFAFEVWVEGLGYDYELVRCEILSNSDIISFNKTPMSLGASLRTLQN